MSTEPDTSLGAGDSRQGSEQADVEDTTPRNLRRGKCKWFNVTKGWGFITPDDGSQDVFVHQSVLRMGGFRSLGENEVVDFEAKDSDKGVEATFVIGPNSSDLHGSAKNRNRTKRFRKTRCYNCGEFADHIAADCKLEAQPKKCHHCKSADHLIADCQTRTSKARSHQSGSTSES